MSITIGSILRAIRPGQTIGAGRSESLLLVVNQEVVRLRTKQAESIRIFPTDLIRDLVQAIREGRLTLDQIIDRAVGGVHIVDALNLTHDKYIFGYERNLFDLCSTVLNYYDRGGLEVREEPMQINLKFVSVAVDSSLQITDTLGKRFISSLLTKRFVVLTGLSGSGKTRLALAFAKWICFDQRNQVCVVPVGADWTNREPLLGYQNALNPDEYIAPDALRLVLRAKDNWESGEGKKPYFLILDEMNLSHVERYFSDFLSAIESDEEIPLHNAVGDITIQNNNGVDMNVPSSVKLPKNLFVIGTVNVDETTYMFSPKVLDRANVIEFRVTKEELDRYLEDPRPIDFTNLEGAGADMAASFVVLATEQAQPINDEQRIKNIFLEFFEHLKLVGADFGFRSAGEMLRYCRIAANFSDEVDVNGLVDAAILQKLLPKLHGSRSKLEGPLKEMVRLCLHDPENVDVLEFLKGERNPMNDPDVRFPLTLEKLSRMHRALIGHGFTSFAEA